MTNKPCRVCGKHQNNQEEPRFGYTVCEQHQNAKPTGLDWLARQHKEELDRISESGGSFG